MKPNDYEKKAYEWWGVPPPKRWEHGTEEDIARKMVRLKPNKWHLEGNKLIGETEWGPLVQFIPTNYICKGTDENGLPLLEKLDL